MSAATMYATTAPVQVGPAMHGRRAARQRGTRATATWTAPVAWAIVLAAFLSLVGILPTARDVLPSRATATMSVTVSSADTLWSIAAAHRLPGMSTAQTVETIVSANRLDDRKVAAGTVLSVPIAGLDDSAFAQADSSELPR
jgi:nucleoid-associated protein YgaU